MTATEDQHKRLYEILECSVCIDVLIDPRTLPCLHTFCFKCIAEWYKDKQPGAKVVCPECRQEFHIPDSGVNGLKKNLVIRNLVRMNEMKQKKAELCGACVDDEDVSNTIGLESEINDWNSYSNANALMKISSSYELVNLNELQSVENRTDCQPVAFCDKHTDKQLELYCFEDKVAVCYKCFFLDHRSHQCEEVKEVVDEFRLGRRTQDLQSAVSELDGLVNVLNSNKQIFSNQIKAVEIQICEEADKRIQLIESHKQKLLHELRDIKTKHELETESLSQEFTQTKSSLTCFIASCEKLLKEGSDVDICQAEDCLRRRTEELKHVKCLGDAMEKLEVSNHFVFSPSLMYEDTKRVLGEVRRDDPQLLFTLNEPPMDRNGDPHQVHGVALLDRYLYVARYGYSKIEVFDCEDHFKKVKDIEVDGMSLPCNMAGCNVTSQLFISQWYSGDIWRVSANTGVSEVFIKLGCNSYATYTSLSLEMNRLLVTSPHSLSIYDTQSGERLKSIPLTEDMKRYGVLHAVESNRGSFFVSQEHNPILSEIDSEGRVIREFNNSEQLACILLALDSVNRLLIADWKNGFVVSLDEHLQHQRVLLDDKRLNNEIPCALSCNKNNNRLAVGFMNGQVKIFEYSV